MDLKAIWTRTLQFQSKTANCHPLRIFLRPKKLLRVDLMKWKGNQWSWGIKTTLEISILKMRQKPELNSLATMEDLFRFLTRSHRLMASIILWDKIKLSQTWIQDRALNSKHLKLRRMRNFQFTMTQVIGLASCLKWCKCNQIHRHVMTIHLTRRTTWCGNQAEVQTQELRIP